MINPEDRVAPSEDQQVNVKLSGYPAKGTKLACAPIEDSDQTAHMRSLITVFDGRSIGSQGFTVSIGGTKRLCSDCVDVYTDLNLRWSHMPSCTLYWIPALHRSLPCPYKCTLLLRNNIV